MKPFLLSLFLAVTIIAKGQTDTTKSYVPDSWDKLYPGIYFGFGTQRAFFTELGFSLQRFIYSEREGAMSFGYYTSFEWNPGSTGKDPVYGVKLGGQLTNNGGAGAIEVKYLFNSNATDVVITPKIGLGMGFVNILYGYNLSTNKRPFPNIRRHQFSLSFNSNIFHHDRERRKK